MEKVIINRPNANGGSWSFLLKPEAELLLLFLMWFGLVEG